MVICQTRMLNASRFPYRSCKMRNSYVMHNVTAFVHAVVEDTKVSWHLINIRGVGQQGYVMDYVRKGMRLLINGRIDYTQVKKEDGSVKDRTTIVAGIYGPYFIC